MKVTVEPVSEDRQVILQIELEEPEVERHKERAYRKLVQRWAVPGFRKGKTPRSVLERYVGAEALLQEDLEQLLESSALEALKQQNLDAVARPEVKEVQSLSPVSFKVAVPLRPQVELGDYKSLRVPWEPPQFTPEQEQDVLETIRRQTTPWEPVERAPQMGDLVTVDIHGVIDGPATEGDASSSEDRVFIRQQGLEYPLQEGSSYPLPGFAQKLAGLEKGTQHEFTMQAPADFAVQNLAGKDCRFTVTIHEVKEQGLAEINDEWAKGVMGGYDSLEALRAKVRADLQERADAQAHLEYEDKVLKALAEQAKVEFPPVLVDSEVNHILQDQDERLRTIGLSLGAHMASSGRTLQQVQDEVRPQAKERVVRTLLVSRLSETEKVEVSPEEIDAEVKRVVEGQPEGEARTSAEQLFANEAARDTIRRRLLARKSVDRLIAIARGEEPASPTAVSEKTAESSAAPTQAS